MFWKHQVIHSKVWIQCLVLRLFLQPCLKTGHCIGICAPFCLNHLRSTDSFFSHSEVFNFFLPGWVFRHYWSTFFSFIILLFSSDIGMPSYSFSKVNFSEKDKTLCFMFVCVSIHMAIYNTISLYSSKNVDNRYYVLLLIQVFIVQVTKLVQYNTFSKIPSTSMHFATRVRIWRVARLSASWCSFIRVITWNSSNPEIVQNRKHVHIHFFA
jgi:hypothetical protein